MAKRTANFTTVQAMIGASGGFNGFIGFQNSANTVLATSNDATFLTQGSNADSSFHAVQGIMNGASSTLASDGTETTGGVGATTMSSNTSRLMRFAGGNSMDGVLCEAGLWSGNFTTGGGGQASLMNSNIHGSNGYNF
jgi:hypothetical protein